MITGTSNFQGLFQGLLSETTEAQGDVKLLQIVKLSNDSFPNTQNVQVNNFPSVQIISGSVDDGSAFAAFGELLTAQVSPKTAWRFDYGVNSRLIFTSGTINGGFVTGSASRAQLNTGVSPSGTAVIYTRRSLRYLPGMGGLVRFTAVFDTGTANSEQKVGIGDTQDGFFFGFNGADFGILRRRAGVDEWTSQSSWNGTPVTFSPTLGNVYQIRFQWLGFGNVYFFVFDKEKRRMINVHTIKYPNTSSLTHILNPTLPIRASISNKGNATNLTMFTPSSLGAIEGVPETQYSNPLNIDNSSDVSATFSDANKNHVITIRNKAVFAGQSNRVPVKIKSIDLSRSGGGTTSANTLIKIYRNAVTADALSFTDIDNNNSPVDVSVSTTTITSTNAERSYVLSQNITSRTIDFGSEGLYIYPGESISIEAQDSGVQSTDVVVTVNWDEEF